ncbi:MAG TPA: hypothetical protein VG164_05080 [Trebonia sp.]|jgi:hypothetical protein|nr:hypothetical protein [Trebonia sp.]
MIRRGFWLVVGAAGGIMGYRRVSSLGRQVSQKLGARPEGRAAVKRHWARETIRFTRDVREGMDLYFDRRRARSAPTLGAGVRAPRSRPQSSTDHDKHDKREDH